MNATRRGFVALLLVAALSACASEGIGPSRETMVQESAGGPVSALAQRHLVSAATPAAAEAPAWPDVAEQAREVEVLRAAWEERLSTRGRGSTFRSLESEDTRRLVEVAADEAAFAAALADGLTLAELEAFVCTRDARIRASREKLRAALHRYPQVVHAQTLLQQYAALLAPLRTGIMGPPKPGVVTPHWPPPGTLALKADLVTHELEMARLELDRTVRDRLVTAHEAFFRLWYLGRALRVQRDILELLKQLEDSETSRLEAGRGGKARVLHVQVESASLEDALISLEEDRRTAAARLREILDVATATELGPPVLPPLPAGAPEERSLVERARRGRQEVSLAAERMNRVDTAIALAEKMSRPEWSAGHSVFNGPGPVGAEGAFGNRPQRAKSFAFAQREAWLAEMRDMRRALEETLDASRRDAEFLTVRAHAALEQARRRLDLHEQVLGPLARQAYEDGLAAYRSGRVEFLSVIDSLRQWLRVQLQEDEARRDVQLAFVRLEAAVGGTLPR